MYELWWDYVKPKLDKKLNYTDSFIVYIKTEDIYSDIAKDVETRFDTSLLQANQTTTKRKKRKVTGLKNMNQV